MYFVPPWYGEFFDSYGFPPETYGMDEYIARGVTHYNEKPLQGLSSDTFGATVYSIYFIEHAILI